MFVARLALPSIPEPLGQTVWTSPVSPFRADCQANAAAQALDALLSDPLLRAQIDLAGFTETMASMDKRAQEKKAKKRKAEEAALASKGKSKGGCCGGKGTGGMGKNFSGKSKGGCCGGKGTGG